MISDTHLTELEMELILFGVPNRFQNDRVSNHIESCGHCRDAIESFAAKPEFWKMTGDLNGILPFCLNGGNEDPKDNSDPVNRLFQASDFTCPDFLDQYRIEREIGRGGMGIVYEAFDTRLDRSVAIKILQPHLLANDTAKRRFRQEARVAAAILHPNIVPVFEARLTGEFLYIAMGLIPGFSLKKLVERRGTIDESPAIEMAIQISSGLAHIHALGLIHRDIKPANILIEMSSQRAMVADFGLARIMDETSPTQLSKVIGTPNFMSPEQVDGQPLDARSDLYSLGGVIYYMTTGRLPFSAGTHLALARQICDRPHVSAQEFNPGVSNLLNEVIDRCLAKSPDERFQTATQLAKSLAAAQPNPATKNSISKPRLESKTASFRDWRVISLSFFVPMFAICLILLFRSTEFPQPDISTSVSENEGAGNDMKSPAQVISSPKKPRGVELRFRQRDYANYKVVVTQEFKIPSSQATANREQLNRLWSEIEAALLNELKQDGFSIQPSVRFDLNNTSLKINRLSLGPAKVIKYTNLLQRFLGDKSHYLNFAKQDNQMIVTSRIVHCHRFKEKLLEIMMENSLVQRRDQWVEIKVLATEIEFEKKLIPASVLPDLLQIFQDHGFIPASGKKIILNSRFPGRKNQCGYFQNGEALLTGSYWQDLRVIDN